MEVFAQACSFPNKQTQVNCGVEQGLGLPAILSPWAWVAAGGRDRGAEGRAPLPIFSGALPKRSCIAQPSPAQRAVCCPAPCSSPARSHNANSSTVAQLVPPNQMGCCPPQPSPCESITNSFAGSPPRAHTHLHPGQSLLFFPQALLAPAHQGRDPDQTVGSPLTGRFARAASSSRATSSTAGITSQQHVSAPAEIQRHPLQTTLQHGGASGTASSFNSSFGDGLPRQAAFPPLPSGPRRPSCLPCGQHAAMNEQRSLSGSGREMHASCSPDGHAAHGSTGSGSAAARGCSAGLVINRVHCCTQLPGGGSGLKGAGTRGNVRERRDRAQRSWLPTTHPSCPGLLFSL